MSAAKGTIVAAGVTQTGLFQADRGPTKQEVQAELRAALSIYKSNNIDLVIVEVGAILWKIFDFEVLYLKNILSKNIFPKLISVVSTAYILFQISKYFVSKNISFQNTLSK